MGLYIKLISRKLLLVFFEIHVSLIYICNFIADNFRYLLIINSILSAVSSETWVNLRHAFGRK